MKRHPRLSTKCSKGKNPIPSPVSECLSQTLADDQNISSDISNKRSSQRPSNQSNESRNGHTPRSADRSLTRAAEHPTTIVSSTTAVGGSKDGLVNGRSVTKALMKCTMNQVKLHNNMIIEQKLTVAAVVANV